MVSSVDPTATPATSQAAPAPAATATASSPAPPPGITASAPDPQQQPQQQNYPPNPYPNYPPPSPTSGGFPPPPQGYPGYQYPPQGAPPQGFYPPQSPHYPQPPSPSQGGFPQYPPPGQQPYPYPPQQYPQQPGQPPQQFPPQQPGQQFPQQYPPQLYPQYPPPGGFQQYPPPGGFPGYGTPSSSIPTINTDTKPSPGYGVNEHDPSYDPSTDANIIKKAFTDRKIDMNAVLGILTKRNPVHIEMLKPHLYRHSPAELTNKSPQTDEIVRAGIQALLYGPRDFNAFLIYTATNKSKSGFSTGFKGAWMLSLALLGRKKEDIAAIKEAYKRMYGDTLLGHLKDALAKKDFQPLHNLYANALEGISNPGVAEVEAQYQQQIKDAVDKEADELFTATVGTVEGEKFAWIFATSSPERLKDIQTAFAVRHKQKLYEVVDKKLRKAPYAELRDELLYVLDGLENKAKRDAKLLEETMKGFGTKDTKLTYRMVAVSWVKDHLSEVKRAYKSRYGKTLKERVDKDTSGDQQKFLFALVDSDEKK